jgi:hypothetical protein
MSPTPPDPARASIRLLAATAALIAGIAAIVIAIELLRSALS